VGKTNFDNVYQAYTARKTEREKHRSLWNTIAKYVGINVDTNYLQGGTQGNKSQQLDEYIDDPTAALSVNQYGDYLIGIMWSTGDKAFKLVPSRYVLERTNQEAVEEYFDYATDQTLYHMNHSDAGLNSALKPYAYDQPSFGTSGIGAFPHKAFINRKADNALLFRQYGVDNMTIDEGKNGMIEYVDATYKWRVSRIVGEFCTDNGVIDKEALAKLPKPIREAWDKKNLNEEFILVFSTFPRDDFNPRLKGKLGTKFCGVWFMEAGKENKIFAEEDFAEKPIAVCRAIKIRNSVWGRASGTMLISTIKAIDFMVATVIEIMEKMSNPSLGIYSNAIFGDNVLDTSPNGLTVFNSALSNGQNPAFPLFDVGDPSNLIKFLIPYLNEKVTTGFKIDALLDFNSENTMTATESLHRYAIRGKSLAGMLQQQKVELLEPLVKRCVSILWDMVQLGVNPHVDTAAAVRLKMAHKENRIIPQAVLDVIADGRPWYEIKFSNELEKMTRTEAVQALLQVINAITAIAALFPSIVEAVDWYKLLKDINDNLDANNQILIGATEFKKKIQEIAQQKQQMMLAQAGQMGADAAKNMGAANKSNAEAKNANAV
jgi:hypothetical protein